MFSHHFKSIAGIKGVQKIVYRPRENSNSTNNSFNTITIIENAVQDNQHKEWM